MIFLAMRYIICWLLVVAIFFPSCDNTPRAEFPFQAFVTIPAGLNVGLSHNFNIFDVTGLNNTQLLEAQPRYVTLTVEYGEANVDFIQQAFFYTVRDSVVQEVAYQMQLPINNAQYAQLFPSILDVKDHIRQPEFDMRLKLIFRSIPITETRIRIDFAFTGTLNE